MSHETTIRIPLSKEQERIVEDAKVWLGDRGKSRSRETLTVVYDLLTQGKLATSREIATAYFAVGTQAPTSKQEEKVRGLVKELRSDLRDYILEKEPSFTFTISDPRKNPGLGYQFEFTVRPSQRGSTPEFVEQVGHSHLSQRLDEGAFRKIGNIIDAIRVTTERILRAKSVQDTSVRWKHNKKSPYFADQEALERWCVALAESKAEVEFLTGSFVDSMYANATKKALGARTTPTRVYRLRNSMPMMNFLLFTYENGQREVFFGYGMQGDTEDHHAMQVYASTDVGLTTEFAKYFAVLKENFSDLISLDDYGVANFAEPVLHSIPNTSGLAISSRWESDELNDMIRRSTEVHIHTTFFLNPSRIPRAIENTLKNGARVSLLMIDPHAEDLLRGRFRLRKDFGTIAEVRKEITSQIRRFDALAAEFPTTFLFRTSDIMPFGAYFRGQSSEDGQWMRIGLMPPIESYMEGPTIKVSPADKKNWQLFSKSWDAVWEQPRYPTARSKTKGPSKNPRAPKQAAKKSQPSGSGKGQREKPSIKF